MLEEFIDGCEYSIDGIVDNEGVKFILVTRKRTLGEEYSFAIDGFIGTTNVMHQVLSEFQAELESAVKATGLSNSFFSFDVLISNNDLYFIDFGCLLDSKIDLLAKEAGLNVYNMLSSALSGQYLNFDYKQWLIEPISSRFIYLKKDDNFQELNIRFDELRNVGHFLSFDNFYSVCKPPISVSDSIGLIISKGHCVKNLWSHQWAFDILKDLNN